MRERDKICLIGKNTCTIPETDTEDFLWLISEILPEDYVLCTKGKIGKRRVKKGICEETANLVAEEVGKLANEIQNRIKNLIEKILELQLLEDAKKAVVIQAKLKQVEKLS
ncbi:MAG TPA: hypothetical protein EYP30_00885 [Archaeoglobaceae archaeon]|nr:hypothetical protein [Archaeoglobaceae archaeon]